MKRALAALAATLLAAVTLTACDGGGDCEDLAAPAPAPQAVPERPSGGTSGGSRSSGSKGSRGTTKSGKSGSSKSSSGGGGVHIDVDCDD